jgi:nucleoside-diphosphate-sugar epimerase
MRVIVTGSDGYIGARLVPYLAARGHEVIPVDAGFYVDGWLPLDGAVPPPAVRKDVRDLDDGDLRDADAIVHLGELSNDPLGQLDPALTYEVNYHASATLARRAKRLGIPRFVYSSSCSVYGAADEGPRTETSGVAPQTAYAECKILVEQALGTLADDRFSPTILRNATAFGASPRMRFDIVLNNLAGLAWTTREIRMVSDGSPWRPLVHVLDICHAFACALEAPRDRVHNEVFNVGDDRQNYRVRDIADIVGAAFPGCTVTFGSLNGDRRSYQVSFEKIHARLPGFRCERDAATGATELRAWFQALSLDREGFEFRAFTRLKQLEHLRATGRIDERLRWRETLAVAA